MSHSHPSQTAGRPDDAPDETDIDDVKPWDTGAGAEPQTAPGRGKAKRQGPPGQAQRRKASRQPPASADDGPPAPVLFGIHAVSFALENPNRVIHRLHATENAERKLAPSLAKRGAAPEIVRVRPRDLDRLLGPDTVHQGVAAEVDELADAELDDLIVADPSNGPIVVLDQVTDPHNVGAVLRSAAVFGAAGLVMTRRHSPPLAGALAKSASGALELVPIARVQNLARALAELKDAGVPAFGLDGAADVAIEAADLPARFAIVLGAEGKGLRQATRDACAALVRITTDGPIASLNVSNAAAVTLHLAAMRRAAPGDW